MKRLRTVKFHIPFNIRNSVSTRSANSWLPSIGITGSSIIDISKYSATYYIFYSNVSVYIIIHIFKKIFSSNLTIGT